MANNCKTDISKKSTLFKNQKIKEDKKEGKSMRENEKVF